MQECTNVVGKRMRERLKTVPLKAASRLEEQYFPPHVLSRTWTLLPALADNKKHCLLTMSVLFTNWLRHAEHRHEEDGEVWLKRKENCEDELPR